MKPSEYYEAKKCIELQRKIVQKLKKNKPNYRKELLKFIELLITVKGNALCMDVKGERRRIARLITDALV